MLVNTSLTTPARSFDVTFGRQLPDSYRDRSSRSSTIRCMRRVFASIVSRKRSRLSFGSSRSRSVSANPAMTVSGVLSSCDTLATKSRRIVSSLRRVVRSWTATTAPPSGSGRAETSSVRSATPISSGPVATPAIAPRTASRMSRCCGSMSVEKGTLARRSRSRRALSLRRTTLPRALTATMPSSSESITAVKISRRDRGRDVAQLDDRLRHGAREAERHDQRAGEREQPGRDDVVARSVDDLAELRGADRHANGAQRMLDGEVNLVVAGRRASPARRPHAVLACERDLGPLVVILERGEVVAVEVGVADDDPVLSN